MASGSTVCNKCTNKISGITTSDKSISNFGGDDEEEEDNDNHDDDSLS
jgi:hypothetical protein